jgi:hypothetical protein
MYFWRHHSQDSIAISLTTLQVQATMFYSRTMEPLVLTISTHDTRPSANTVEGPLLPRSIRDKLLRNAAASTLSGKLVRFVELPMMAKTTGFDGILIDMEHSSFDLDTTG